jgi:hypothetical protein
MRYTEQKEKKSDNIFKVTLLSIYSAPYRLVDELTKKLMFLGKEVIEKILFTMILLLSGLLLLDVILGTVIGGVNIYRGFSPILAKFLCIVIVLILYVALLPKTDIEKVLASFSRKKNIDSIEVEGEELVDEIIEEVKQDKIEEISQEVQEPPLENDKQEILSDIFQEEEETPQVDENSLLLGTNWLEEIEEIADIPVTVEIVETNLEEEEIQKELLEFEEIKEKTTLSNVKIIEEKLLKEEDGDSKDVSYLSGESVLPQKTSPSDVLQSLKQANVEMIVFNENLSIEEIEEKTQDLIKNLLEL